MIEVSLIILQQFGFFLQFSVDLSVIACGIRVDALIYVGI